MKRVSTLRGLTVAMAATSGVTVVAVGATAQQDSAAPEEHILGEVTVTAQRRTENLQDVPIAVTVLTGDMLANKGVSNLVELQYAAPGFTVADYGSANVLNIRGIGRSAVDIELPSGVVLYRDGFPTFPGYFQNEPYYDIASVEVLRGPQGTFAGKSAAGGAVLIRTAGPDLSELSGKFEGEVGNYNYFGGTAVANVPLSGTFGVRAALHHEQRGDYLVDSLSGPYVGRPGEPRLNSVRLGALWEPRDNLSAEFRVDASDLDFGGNITTAYGHSLRHPVNDANFKYRDKSWRTVGNVKYTFENDLVLSSVTGWQRVHTVNNFDRNGSTPDFNRFDSEGVFELYSQEFNLISPDGVGPFSYVLGVFAQRTESEIFDWREEGFNIYLVAGDPYPTISLETPYLKREDEISAFADFKYSFAENWQVELGVRYSEYELWSDINVVLQTVPGAPPATPIFVGTPELREDDVDAKLTLTYRLGEESNIYGLVARGHINGGFNIVGGFPFDKEEIIAYELGWKASWAGGRVRTQLGGYYQTLSNFQAQFASADLPNQNILQNADGKSKIKGIEASMQARLDQFTFDVAAAFLDSELGVFPDVVDPTNPPAPGAPPNFVNLSGGTAPFSPEFTLNVGASYEFIVSPGLSLTPRVDVSHVDDANGAVFESPRTLIASRTLVNAALRMDRDRWYAEAYGTNLADKRYVAGVQDLGNIWYPGAPRQYGLRVGVSF
jgi:iron complex outermembrane recepter protein